VLALLVERAPDSLLYGLKQAPVTPDAPGIVEGFLRPLGNGALAHG